MYAHYHDRSRPDVGDVGRSIHRHQKEKNQTALRFASFATGNTSPAVAAASTVLFNPNRPVRAQPATPIARHKLQPQRGARPSRSKQRTQETLRDRSESFPPLLGRSKSRGNSSSRPGSTERQENSKRLAWESGTSGDQADTTPQENTQRGASLQAQPQRDGSPSRPRAGRSSSRATQGPCGCSKSATQSPANSPQDSQNSYNNSKSLTRTRMRTLPQKKKMWMFRVLHGLEIRVSD
ncbi:hypothetical protein MTO96_047421 [Rhipicephalus appendiculatus]